MKLDTLYKRTKTGTIIVRPWNDEIGLYSAITQQVNSYRIIKTTGLLPV